MPPVLAPSPGRASSSGKPSAYLRALCSELIQPLWEDCWTFRWPGRMSQCPELSPVFSVRHPHLAWGPWSSEERAWLPTGPLGLSQACAGASSVFGTLQKTFLRIL